jgi:hypothetical protein
VATQDSVVLLVVRERNPLVARAVMQHQPTNPISVAPFRPFATGRRSVGADFLWAPSVNLVSLGSKLDIV